MTAKTDGVLYACHPCYGGGHRGSHRQFWSKSIKPDSPYAGMQSQFDDYGSSLLADAFNTHWKTALNLQLSGVPITRFLMLHDDVVPEDDYATKLLTTLDRTGADLVSAVVPIKDRRALSSTAVDDPNDPWEVYKRLTMKEIGKLPEVFDEQDVAKLFKWPQPRHLLANTGCWVCDFTKPWRLHVHFNITSRIAFQCADGRVVPTEQYLPGAKGAFINQVMSEDWQFSRLLNQHGATLAFDRTIKLFHMGEAPYNNQDHGWGTWQEDESLKRKFDPEDAEPDVEGWLTIDEGRLLARLAKGKRVLEIGSWCGKSTIWIARTAQDVQAVDTFDGTGTPNPRNTLEEFKLNLDRYKVGDKVDIHVGKSSNVLRDCPRLFDMAFIDGAHDSQSVQEDTWLALMTLKPDGLLVFHDYETNIKEHQGVKQYVATLLQEGFREVERVDSIIVLTLASQTNPAPLVADDLLAPACCSVN